MIKCVHYERAKQGKKSLENFSDEIVNQAIKFHKSFPAYMKTPLTELKNLAAYVGVSEIYVKDESYRFGLNSFKALGGSYAIGKYLASHLKKEIEELPFEKMVSREIKEELGDLTFVSATDGNHGRGVAWTANQLNQKSVIYMPKGSSEERLENIRAEGAQADITEFNYDDAVRLADKMAREKGWIMVPVSYTHLDVYKRQVYHSEDGDCCLWCIWIFLLVFSDEGSCERLRDRRPVRFFWSRSYCSSINFNQCVGKVFRPGFSIIG